MTEPEDPSRLLDSASAPAGLRDALRSAQADVGTDQQIARLGQKLAPLLGAALLPASSASTVAGASATVKLGAAAALTLMIAGGGAWLLSASHPPPHDATPPAHSKPVAGSPAAPAPAGGALDAPSAVVPSEPSNVAEAPVAPPALGKSLPSKPTPAAQPTEAELLEQARSALKSDPARALAKANEDARLYPRGVLVQEREVIAIQALRRLGRSAEADRRAEAFGKAFPGSAFQRKLNANP